MQWCGPFAAIDQRGGEVADTAIGIGQIAHVVRVNAQIDGLIDTAVRVAVRQTIVVQRSSFTAWPAKGIGGVNLWRCNHNDVSPQCGGIDTTIGDIAVKGIVNAIHMASRNRRKGINQLHFIAATIATAITGQDATEEIGPTVIGQRHIAAVVTTAAVVAVIRAIPEEGDRHRR